MKKIGIVTQYTNSCNYGGCIQAYALCEFLNKLGYDAKQIRYTRSNRILNNLPRLFRHHTFIIRIREKILSYVNRCFGRFSGEQKNILILKNSFTQYRDSIPHTSVIYNEDSIDCCNDFDIYIAGSDQIWTIKSDTEILDKFFWLRFVKHKKKISYAASIGASYIPNRLYADIENVLSDFDAISVRQKHDKELLDYFIKDKKITWVLDPTMLLSYADWITQCDDNPYADDKYIFAYLLGHSRKDREFIMLVARHLGMKVITIPYLLTEYRSCDKLFGDIKLFNVTPRLWLSLIKDAKYVFTDSFHCIAFSLTFHTEFFALKRYKDNDINSINSRIESLLSLTQCNNRIIANSVAIDFVHETLPLDFNKIDLMIEKERKKSIDFLKNALEFSL